MRQRITMEQRFWRSFTRSPEGCWEWTGSQRRSGYGRVWVDEDGRRTVVSAHRLSYELHRGPIPDGKVIDHLCRNRACVNPEHLEVVENRENVLRGVGPTAVNASKTACKRGHEFTPENTYVTPSTGSRVCRACLSDRMAEYRRRKRAERSAA